MNIKTLHLVIIGLLVSVNSFSQSTEILELPFFDDFEQSDNHDGPFQKWTTENLEGWHYWHIVPGQYMRFENTDLAQNDWLITSPINCLGIENLKVNFNHLYSVNKVPPRLYYTNQYNGDASQSVWTELNYSFGENENQWYSSEDFIIENLGDEIYFAFHYQAEPNAGAYFLLDNFSLKEYIPIEPFDLVGSSEHFEFYTNLTGAENFYVDIQNELEIQFLKLSSLWNRPGLENVFNENEKIKIYYSEKADIDKVMVETPNWKSGFHDAEKKEIYLSPISNTNQENYYANLINLAINEFSQMAISKKFLRENSNYFPAYFLEGFGLYEMGVRPRRDSIIKYLNENPVPDFNFLKDTTNISTTLKKDLILSNIEGQILTTWSYLGVGPGYCCSYTQAQWPNYLKYFYQYPEQDRIKLHHESSHFNFYLAESDSNHFSEYMTYFEDAYIFFTENYSYIPEHRFNVVIIPTEQIGMDLTGYSRFNGGAGCGGDLNLMLSPNYNFNQETYDVFYAGMSAHEFFHIYYNHFMSEIPSGFWAEGSADFSARHSLGEDIRSDRFWMIEWTFNEYAKQYNVELDLEHISTNPNLELDIYYLGEMFFEYLYINYGGFEKIREFFNNGMDYSVFNATYDEIDTGYINYLKGFISSELDDDNDGVMNNLDTCPDTPTGEDVNETGCSQSQIDDDGDGVMNNVDACPNTQNGEEVNVTGCSENQKDDDEDGVMNYLDLCPNTTVGTTVNENGCFFLPSNNFNIEVTSETCPNKNNGELTITANETYSYSATINNVIHNFNNNSLTVANLTPGTYTVCISVTGETFEQCYTIVIAEGKTVSGKASVISNKVSIAIQQGTAPYNVYVNGISVLNTLASSFIIDVKHGDLLEVKTAIYCEGVFLKTIDLFENITVYPNPSRGIFEITLPISESEVVIELYTMSSQLISKETYQVVNGKVQINLENKHTGVYVVKIQLDTPVSLTLIKE